MHPPLHIIKHQHCKEVIEALQDCHKNHSIAKFWGHCNDQKWALDRCLREEKAINRKVNGEKAKAEKERLRIKLEAKQAKLNTADGPAT